MVLLQDMNHYPLHANVSPPPLTVTCSLQETLHIGRGVFDLRGGGCLILVRSDSMICCEPLAQATSIINSVPLTSRADGDRRARIAVQGQGSSRQYW